MDANVLAAIDGDVGIGKQIEITAKENALTMKWYWPSMITCRT